MIKRQSYGSTREGYKRWKRGVTRKKQLQFISIIMTFVMAISSFMVDFSGKSVFGEGEDSKFRDFKVSVDKSSVLSGEEFTYQIDYAYSSNNIPFEGEEIKVTLPEPLEYIRTENSADVESVDSSASPVVFKMKTMGAGTTGFVKLTARFKPGSINVQTKRTSIVTDGAATVTPMVPEVTGNVNNNWTWTIDKSRIYPLGVSPVPGSDVTYRIAVTGNALLGGMSIANVVVTDTLPANSVFKAASGDGVEAEGVVTWNIPTLGAGEVKTFTLTVNYPAGTPEEPLFKAADSIVNTAKAVSGAKTITDSDTLTLAAPAPAFGGLSKKSRQENDRYEKGQMMEFVISGFGNAGNVPLDNVVLMDQIPDGMDLTSVSKGTADRVEYQVYGRDAETNLNTNPWMEWTDPSVKPALGQDPEGNAFFIENVRWTYNRMEVGTTPASLWVKGPLLEQKRIVNAPIVRGDTLTNRVTLNGEYNAAPLIEKTASATIVVGLVDKDHAPWLVVTKACSKTSAYPKDTVTYTVRIKNHAYATGDLVLSEGNFVDVKDILPLESDGTTAVFKEVTAGSLSGTAQSVGSIAETRDANTVLWKLSNTVMKPGQYVDITYSATVADQALVGKKTNTVEVTPDPSIYVDPRAGASAPYVKSADLFVKFTGSLRSVKGIKGHVDAGFEYAELAPVTKETFHGGIVKYQVKVSNENANGPISNVVIVDKLPFIGDSGVIVPTQRGSQWQPYLINVITGQNGTALPNGVKVYYSTSAAPSLAKLYNPAGTDSGWSLTPPKDITSVQALKFEFGNIVFAPGGAPIILEWEMRAPADAPVNFTAWNSFAYGATHEDIDSGGNVNQMPFLPAEPIKVGMKVVSDGVPPNLSLGNYIWEDKNRDGIQNDGETGLNGILVKLYKSGNAEPFITRTGDNQDGKPGYYLFPHLAEGTYTVEFEMPEYDSAGNSAVYYITPKNAAGSTAENDSDFALHDAATRLYRTDSFYLNADNRTLDAGIYQKTTVGNYVWNDRNRNGVQDSGEPVLKSIKVELLDSAGNAVAETTTDVNGKYYFGGQNAPYTLDPGTYKIRFTCPSNDFKFTKTTGNLIDPNNSDIVDIAGLTGTTGEFTLLSGTPNFNVDAGMYLGQLGNLVWHDANGNGLQDDGSSGISGVTVRLLDASGNPARDAFNNLVSAVTSSSGVYNFYDLKAGSYIVEFVKPAKYSKFSLLGSGAANDTDSNADRSTGRTGLISLEAGEINTTIDAGMYSTVSLGDRVWLDADANGLQTAGEAGVPGITVQLLKSDGVTAAVYEGGALVAPAVTDANGYYSFSGLEPGAYRVSYINTNASRVFTLPNVPNNENLDSDTIPNANHTQALTLAATVSSNPNLASGGLNNPDIDAGLHAITPGIKIEKTVYDGHNGGNSVGTNLLAMPLNSKVTYLFKVTNTGNVHLKDIAINDPSLAIDRTDMAWKSGSTGTLAPGAVLLYYYETTLADNLTNTAVAEGSPCYDSAGNLIPGAAKPTASDTAEVVKIVPGIELDKTVYTGHYQAGKIGVELVAAPAGAPVTYLFSIKNTTNRYLKDIALTDPDLHKTKADMHLKSGSEPLAPGATLVYYYETTLSGNLVNRANVTGTPCNQTGTPYSNAQKPTDTDTAEVQIGASLGDTVWYDVNGNGVQDGGEEGIPGVQVVLYRGDTQEETAVTDAAGYYCFKDLLEGTYTVKVVGSTVPEGYVQSYDLDLLLDGQTTKLLNKSDAIVTADFGYKPVPNLLITKAVDKFSVVVGETVNYTITVKNVGKAVLNHVVIKDSMLNINRLIEKLDVGSEAVIIRSAYITNSTNLPGPLVNTATVESDETPKQQGTATVQLVVPSTGGGGGGGGTPPKDPATPPVVPPPVVVPGTPNPPVTPGTPLTPPVTPPVVTPPGDTPKPVPIIIDDKIPEGPVKISVPENGIVTVDPDGHYVYVPDPGFTGKDSFTVTVTLPDGTEKTELIEIEVEELAQGVIKLPKTGEWPQEVFWMFGGLLLSLGLILRRKYLNKEH